MDTQGVMDVKTHQPPNYFAVFIILVAITAVMTAIELSHIEMTSLLRNTLFITLSIIKAILVAMYYMHLKFDSRLYTGLFMLPVFLVLVLIIILLV